MYEKAKKRFDKYIQDNFDIDNEIVKRKYDHTCNVVKMVEYICDDLNLTCEDKELAKVIALLHDIGRFEQSRQYSSLIEASKKINHAALGVKVLFDNNWIREFIEQDSYDNIIELAIFNHNKYKLETDNLNDKEILHCKLIRDADKADNFRVKVTGDITSMAKITKYEVENSNISDKVFNDFMSKKTILSSDRKTAIDIWISYIAFIFDFNFTSGLKYIYDENYINILIDRFNYKNPATKDKMELIRLFANDYISDRLEIAKHLKK